MAPAMKDRVRHIHFVGVGGAGMCGIAEVFHNLGYTVTGSDIARGVAVRRLEQLGVKVCIGHAAQNAQGADALVFSSAVKEGNPEIAWARENGVPTIPRAMMLAELMRFQAGIAVAGTHGKTTTTSLVASVLAAANFDPTFVIGGKLNASGSNARLGKGKYIVAEADESDASFLCLTPLFSIVTNIDEDHMDTYGHSRENLEGAFVDFIHRLPFYGKAFLCVDSPMVRAILPKLGKPCATYSVRDPEADLFADRIEAKGAQMRFLARVKSRELSFGVTLNIPGLHNVANALAAIGVAMECGCTIQAIQDGLRGFEGVGRRFQRYGDLPLPDGGAAMVVDDYGHHPNEMRATIAAARAAFPGRRLVLAFQPHRFTRTRDLFDDFVDVLSTVDQTVLVDVYPAGESPIDGADSAALARALGQKGAPAIYAGDVADAPGKLYAALRDGDVAITMGAGSVGRVPSALFSLARLPDGVAPEGALGGDREAA